MNKYRNKKTGAIISISSELNGGDWERYDAKKAKKAPEKKDEKKGG